MSEIDDIRRRYETGELNTLRDDLERFLMAHRENIRAFQNHGEDRGLPPLSDEVAVKFYILKNRTVNPQRDIDEQRKEIEKEKWIRGMRSGEEPDPQEVAMAWAQEHSAPWRAHRVTSIVFVFEQEKDRYLKLLQ